MIDKDKIVKEATEEAYKIGTFYNVLLNDEIMRIIRHAYIRGLQHGVLKAREISNEH